VKFEIERDGDVLEVGFKPDLNAAKSFTLPTPDLGSGAFSVTFSVIGEDGHTVAGHFGFGVGAAAPAASTGH
jgi:methionine-rich copper-binding protein CopC